MDPKDINPSGENRFQVGLRWLKSEKDAPRAIADETAIAFLGHKVYMTFGEIVPPDPADASLPVTAVEMRPTGTVVLSDESFLKLRTLINNVADQIVAARKKTEI
jgi:hypothetical protein